MVTEDEEENGEDSEVQRKIERMPKVQIESHVFVMCQVGSFHQCSNEKHIDAPSSLDCMAKPCIWDTQDTKLPPYGCLLLLCSDGNVAEGFCPPISHPPV